MRPPSTNWEAAPLLHAPNMAVWAWFKPGQAPSDVLIRIPPETYQACGGAISIRQLMLACGVNPAETLSWTVHGGAYDTMQGRNPLLDQPAPPPVPWLDSTIAIRVLTGATPVVPAPAPPAAPQFAPTGPASTATLPTDDQALRAFAQMEADWFAILQAETQLDQLRKQLGAVQGRLGSLGRDLTPDERMAADNIDKKDWQDARRWMRDAASQVSRYIREYTVGVTSAAGQRGRFEELYETYVVPRQNFEGLARAQHEMEVYRKLVQSLVIKMQGVLSSAGRDGEQRAQQVLSRIAAKMRNSRSKRG